MIKPVKAVLSVLFSLSVALAVGVPVQAQFGYITNNGAITITGYTGSASTVTIPDAINGLPVTGIESGVFPSNLSLTNVVLGTNVIDIGDGAFATCIKLAAITVSDANPAYATAAGVLFNKNLTTLVEYPAGRSGSYVIPGRVTAIEADAFEASGLSSVTIPNSVTNIGEGAFSPCGLTNVMIPESVTTIADNTFNNCLYLSEAMIPSSVTSIGDYAFYWCTSLLNVAIPDSVTNVGWGVFACSNLTSVTIPASVASLGGYAFNYASSLQGIYFRGNAPAADGTQFWADRNGTVYYLPGTVGWGATYGFLPTAPWYLPDPMVLTQGPGFGVQSGEFGFTISWATNAAVVVEASSNLAPAVWLPVVTNTLAAGAAYFGDPQWTNFPARFYRVRSP